MRLPVSRPEAGSEDGAASIELAILAPILLLVLSLIFAFGRYAQAENVVDQAARDGARAATAQNSKEQARPVAEKVMKDAVAEAPSSCRDSAQLVDFKMTDGAFELPDPNEPTRIDSVKVTVRCTLNMSDLSALHLGNVPITRTFTSPLDRYRGYR